ncbi:GNAT family N-acetyltransferase [Paenibacillus soyae]|uniref:GNAT family N-acetyltransferase n=1 Tax=Paenibacillus soyae TaxID=2969249 RepID=A0A9X2MLD5_9BACL|nr:GNAT family protein [Paenibacillus soyae]MCR2802781.1 GNAT family N-acetyltransferase [Paenibacillus soyae]
MPLNYWKSDIITLRALKSTDAKLFQQFDDEVSRNVDQIYPPQSDERQSQWLESEQKSRIGDQFRWVAENAAGEAIGTINTFSCDRRNGTFKYGITLLPAFRGQGNAREMIRMVLRYYFFELNYQKVTPHVYSFNQSSIALHEKMGFVREGQLRSMIYSNGEYFDEIHYGITRSEFERLYGKE